jgi:DNA polymerase type B, organellar and viral
MIELCTPEDRVAVLVWHNAKWGMEFPVSGDTLAMSTRATPGRIMRLKMRINAEQKMREAYRGGVVDREGFHALNRLAAPGTTYDVNSLYPRELTK